MNSLPLNDPPHSLEAEQTVLGALLLDPEGMLKIKSMLSPQDFYDPVFRTIYQSCEQLFDDRRPIDFTTVSEELSHDENIQSIGGAGFLAGLSANVPTSSHIVHYASIVREKARQRALIKVGQEITALGLATDASFAESFDTAQEKILQLGSGTIVNTAATLGDVSEAIYDNLIEIRENGEGDEAQRFYTGFSSMDYLFEGLRPQDLTVIVGRPGMGKTSLMLTMAINGAEKFDKKVLFMSLEMSKVQLTKRLDSSRLGISMKEMDRGELDDRQMNEFGNLITRFKQLSFVFDDDPESSMTNVRAKAMRHKLEHGLDVLFVDYLQLLEPPTGVGLRYSNRAEQLSKISRDMKKLARELDVPVIAGCQMNRAVDARPDKRPQLSDIRESGSIEQDADNVLMLHSDRYYDNDPDSDIPDVTQVFIKKHRQGQTGIVELMFKKDTTTFVEVDRAHEGEDSGGELAA